MEDYKDNATENQTDFISSRYSQEMLVVAQADHLL